MRVVGPTTPNRVGHVLPHSVQDDTGDSPPSGSVVPSWSQRSMRSVGVSLSMWIVNGPLAWLGPDGLGERTNLLNRD
jgi:hypothetical protein